MVAGACFQLVELFVKLTLTLVTTEEEKGWWFYCSEKKQQSNTTTTFSSGKKLSFPLYQFHKVTFYYVLSVELAILAITHCLISSNFSPM